MKISKITEKTFLINVFIYGFILFPQFVSAQQSPRNLQDIVQLFIDFNLVLLLPLAFSAGLLFFMWRGASYIFKADSEEGKTEGKRVLTWGVIALFLMASIWGIIKFFESDILGITSPTEIKILDRTSR